MEIDLTVNGRQVTVDANATTPLLDVLRNNLDLKGSRYGCGLEQCGACMVLIDGGAEYSCAREIGAISGRSITTIEGLGNAGTSASAAARLPERAGGPVRLLPIGHHYQREGAARPQSEAVPNRYR
jgi:aerobic-type carbon monoxide dehydrogenase small subunit (CoxS/CutS family)